MRHVFKAPSDSSKSARSLDQEVVAAHQGEHEAQGDEKQQQPADSEVQEMDDKELFNFLKQLNELQELIQLEDEQMVWLKEKCPRNNMKAKDYNFLLGRFYGAIT